jgi:hypothetical protein
MFHFEGRSLKKAILDLASGMKRTKRASKGLFTRKINFLLYHTKSGRTTQNLVVRHKIWWYNTKSGRTTQNLVVQHKIWLYNTKSGRTTQLEERLVLLYDTIWSYDTHLGCFV